MPDNLHWPFPGARPGQGPIRRSGEFSDVRCGAFYSAIDTRQMVSTEAVSLGKIARLIIVIAC